ncbi:hypothetical protein D3C73_1596500 [compost metagenome]
MQENQGEMGVVEPEFAHQQELRHHIDLPGHGDGGDIAEKQRVLVGKMQLGERVGRKA